MSFSQKSKDESQLKQFVTGGLAGMLAAAVTHPIDSLKVRMQLQEPFPFHQKVLVGMMAGAGGAVVGTPADVIMVRMQADGKLPANQRRNYKGAFNGIARISKEEGVFSLWKGCGPNLVRAMFMTAGQIASYDQAKQMMMASGYFQDNIKTHLIASTISAFVASLVTSPIDVIKTRIMNTKKGATPLDKPQYTGTVDCFTKTFKSEGLGAFYKGFGPYFLRLGPHTILTFLFVEQLSKLWKQGEGYLSGRQ
eukprot:gene1483-1721_t